MSKGINYNANRKKYTELENSYNYQEILRVTQDYNRYATINFKKYNIKIIFKIKSLIFFGRFDEALNLCYEALDSKILNDDNNELVNYYVFMIHLYKREFIKCISLLTNIKDFDENKTRLEKFKRVVEDLIYTDNPETYNKLFPIEKENFVTHVKKRRREDFNIDFDIIADAIINNFYKARVYYQNSTEVRIFRCFNVGKSDYYGKNETCSYIIVYSKNGSIKSLITAYLEPSVNNLEFCDITSEVYEKLENKNETNNEIKSASLDKFRVRQSKKKN